MGNEEFDFYEDSKEEEKIEKKGITGDVTNFTFTGMQYPCILFNEDFQCPKHKLNVIKNMVGSAVGTKDISLYFINNQELFKIGMIDGLQINFFLEVVGEQNVTAYYDAKTPLRGGLIYTLSTVA